MCNNRLGDTSDSQILQKLSVRPIFPGERARWDQLVRQYHYLGLRGLTGKNLRYVACVESHWLALIGWQAAALKCAPRDQWIGWNPITQFQRLHLIANNARFLILPHAHIKNLASRVLSLNLKRLSEDWVHVYQHPLLLAETFVDPDRFSGTCYKAANWLYLGRTKGFAKSGNKYRSHGCPKLSFVYPLQPNAASSLKSLAPNPRWRKLMQSVRLSNKQMQSLQEKLRSISDPRSPQGRQHPYAAVLTIAIAATLAGSKCYTHMEEWAGRLKQNQLKRIRACFKHKLKKFIPPSEPTIRRVIQESDPHQVEEAFGSWMMEQGEKDEAIASDGKALKGAFLTKDSIPHLLSAVLQNSGLSIAQRQVDEKSNEIPEIQNLLEPLEIENRVITADALHTQKETVQFLVEKKSPFSSDCQE